MRQLKTQPSNKRRREQEQAERDLDQELQQYQQTYDRDRDITQKIPLVSMYNLVHGEQ